MAMNFSPRNPPQSVRLSLGYHLRWTRGDLLHRIPQRPGRSSPFSPSRFELPSSSHGAWYIWWERKQAVHGERIQTPARSALSITTITMNYMRARRKKTFQIKDGWQKPLEGNLKINVDTAFDEDLGIGATGAVIRNASGACVSVSMHFVPYVVDAPMAEAQALHEGLLLAQRIGVSLFYIQSDCMQVVDTMNDGGVSATATAPIFDECCLLWGAFNKVSIEYCNREANSVAHCLARNVFINKFSCNWDDDPPSFILGALASDVTILSNQ